MEKFYYLSLLLIFQFYSTVESAKFTQVPPSVLYVLSGQNASFVWDYYVADRDNDFRSNSPIWKFYTPNGNEQIIAVEDKFDRVEKWKWKISPTTCPPRLLNPTRVSKESTATLVISNVTTVDNGVYGCSLTLRSTSITSKVQLIVTVPPRFNGKPPLTKNIAEGQDLSLSCTAIGPPTPNITWLHIVGNKRVIKSKGKGSATLSIQNIRRDQNGTYECQAKNNPNENPVITQTVITVYYPPNATVIPTNIEVTQGGEIVLKCTATGNPLPFITWTKAVGVIKPGHTAGKTLRIPDASKTDAGKYICTADNVYGSGTYIDTAFANVVVKYQPSILLDKLLNQKVNETESLSIKCEADGYPTPVIKWKTPTGSVYTGKVYNIPLVKKSDAGTYTCTANNGIGEEVMASIQVTVQYKPTINESKSSISSKSWNLNSIHLKCVATGLPTPRISWYKPTNQQITTGYKNIKTGGSVVNVTTTHDQGDYGQYKCRATNIVGSDEHAINVTQLFPPGPVSITITDIEASSITVRWKEPANDGGSDVTGYKVKVNSKDPVNTVNNYTVITGLNKNTQYVVKVYAKNVVGYGNVSTTMTTTKKQGKPRVPELTVSLNQETGLSVRLTWTKPDGNGGEIKKYTIYMKEVSQSDWTKIDDVIDPSVLKYTITKDIEFGKTYRFIVTAWNKYGESADDDSIAKTIKMPEDTPTDKANTDSSGSNKGKRSSDDSGSNTAVIVGGVGAVLLMLIAAAILVVIVKKKGLLNMGLGRKSRSSGSAYNNDIDPDSGIHQGAVISLNDEAEGGIPTYAAVDMSKKKKKDDIPTYAAVDKTKKKSPGEIIYAELADFNTAGTSVAEASRPITYTETDYADISQFRKQDEPEATYANFPGRNKTFTNIQGM